MAAAPSSKLCILSKTVHTSEKNWCRLVIPGAQIRFWTAMQKELECVGSDYVLYIQNEAGDECYRWGARMTVQRPMLLEMGHFFASNGVQEGDTIQLFRDVVSNKLTAVRLPGAGSVAPAASTAGAKPAPKLPRSASNANAEEYAEAVEAAAATNSLPGERWLQHANRLVPGGAKAPRAAPKAAGGGGGKARKRSPATSDDDDEDANWSPRARRGGGRAKGQGPLPARRKLEVAPEAEPEAQAWSGGLDKATLAAVVSEARGCELSDSDEDTADVVYTEDELKLLQVLCDAAARAVQSAA